MGKTSFFFQDQINNHRSAFSQQQQIHGDRSSAWDRARREAMLELLKANEEQRQRKRRRAMEPITMTSDETRRMTYGDLTVFAI